MFQHDIGQIDRSLEWEWNLLIIAPQYSSVIMRKSVLNIVDLESSGQGPKFWQFFSEFLNVWGCVHFYPVWEMGFLFNDILHIFSRVNCSKIFFSMSFQQCILNFSFYVAPHSITGTFPVTRFCEEKTNGDPKFFSQGFHQKNVFCIPVLTCGAVAHSNNWSFAQIFQLHNFGLESSMHSFSTMISCSWDGCGAMIVILGVDEGCVDFIGKSWWWCPDMISQRSCWDIMFEDNFCQIKVWMHSKIDQTSLFCAFIPLPSKKKHENVKKYNFLQMISCWDICHLSGC